VEERETGSRALCSESPLLHDPDACSSTGVPIVEERVG